MTPHETRVGNTVTFSGTGCPRAGDHSSPRSAVRRRAAERALTSCLGVTPMTHAGRIASLEVRGIGVCPRDPPPGLVELRLHPPGEDPSIPGGILPAATADPDGTGHWSGTIPVPATAEPGRYVLSASCTYSRAETAWYTGVPVTIG